MSQQDLDAAQRIFDEADAQRRELTPAEEHRVDQLISNARRSELTQGRRTAPNSPRNAPNVQTRYVGSGADAGMWGWRSPGEYLAAVRGAFNPEGGQKALEFSTRLQNAPTTFGTEGVGPDGGYAVPPDFRATILAKVMGEQSLLALTDQIPTSSSGVTFPKDEGAPWGTTGIQAYWTGEAQQKTQSKPNLETSTIKTHKLTALVPVSDELLEDAPALAGYVTKKAGDVIDFKVSDAIVNGTGAGMPLGILNSPATVSVAKETSQIAATIHGLNLIKLWSRMPASWRTSAVWLAHPDVEPLLMQAGLQIGPAAAGTATGGQLAWQPAGGLSQSPYDTLFGRPIIPTQTAAVPGTVGDLVFASLGQYCAVIKNGGLKTDVSIHLFFDYDVTAFRFVFRMGGQPWWSSPLAAKNGATTYGPFVTLDTRG